MGTNPVLFELAEGTVQLICNGSATQIRYENGSGAVAAVFADDGTHSDDNDGVNGDLADDGTEDMNPARTLVPDADFLIIPFDGAVIAGANRGMRLGIGTDENVAFVEVYVDFSGGSCGYLAKFEQYAL